jgi:type IV pilus assembly protein PilC
MSKKQFDLVGFYQQMAVLTKAALPLPETLRQLAASAESGRLSPVLDDLAQQTGKGRSLAEAMEQHPKVFPAFHVQLVRIGEQSNILPHIIGEIARLARANVYLMRRMRESLAYPLACISIALVIYTALLFFVVPGFAVFFSEMFMGQPLPTVTSFTFGLSALVVSTTPLFIALNLMLIGFVLIVLSGHSAGTRAVARVFRLIPLAHDVTHYYDYARLTTMWSAYLRYSQPMDVALSQTSSFVESASLRRRILKWREAHLAGRQLKDVLSGDPGVDGVLALTVEHSAEEDLADELEELSTLYLDRAEWAGARLILLWDVMLVVLLGGLVGSIVFSLFLPLVKMLSWLGM